MLKLNVLLAKTDQLASVIKKNITDSITQFNNKQAHFKGEKSTYAHRKEEFSDPGKNVDKPVASTVKEWLDYTFKHAVEYLDAKLDQEATNCSGTAKAELIVEGHKFGILTSGELMALKGFFEAQMLRNMFEAMPTISLTERWQKSENPEYSERGIMESPIQKWVDKATETIPHVEWDPAGKAQGVTINIKNTVEKADVTFQKFTGEISHIERAAILSRLTKLIIAIKAALEQANHAEVIESQLNSEKIFTYLKG